MSRNLPAPTCIETAVVHFVEVYPQYTQIPCTFCDINYLEVVFGDYILSGRDKGHGVTRGGTLEFISPYYDGNEYLIAICDDCLKKKCHVLPIKNNT